VAEEDEDSALSQGDFTAEVCHSCSYC
jgi:hypothetical protein